MSLSQAKLNLEQAKSAINSFLGLEKNVHSGMHNSFNDSFFKVEVDQAITKAYDNNPDLLSYEQQLIEANRQIAEARGRNGIDANVQVNLGIQ